MYTLVKIDFTPDGCQRLETVPVETAEQAAQNLLDSGTYPWHAVLMVGHPIAEEFDDNNPLWVEFEKLHTAMIEEGEHREYLRLKKKYEGEAE